MPKISIIVPAYNYAEFLPFTLDSIKAQSEQDWECLIVDDGSKDNTKEVSGNYVNTDSRFKYFFKENGGLSSARNHGLKFAAGKYVCFLDADDLLERDFLKTSSEYLDSLGKDAVAFERFIKFFDSNEPDYMWFKDYDYKQGFQQNYFERLVDRNSLPPCAPMLSLSIIKNNNIEFDESLTSYEDWDFWLKVSEKYPFYFVDKENAAARIRFHSNSMSTNLYRMDFNQLKVRLKLREKLKDKHLVKINDTWIESCAKSLLYSIADLLDEGKTPEAKDKLLKIIEIFPHWKIKTLNKNQFLSHPRLFRKTAWILWERIRNIVRKK